MRCHPEHDDQNWVADDTTISKEVMRFSVQARRISSSLVGLFTRSFATQRSGVSLL